MAEPLLGEIQVFGFNFAPYQWSQCWGQIMNISQNTALYSLLGINYGGNGTVTFALPDLRGRVAIGQGTGPGLTERTIGETGGTENVSLTLNQLPMHTHIPVGIGGQIKVSSQNGTQPNPSSTVNTLGGFEDATLAATNSAYNNQPPDVTLNVGPALSGGSIGISGGSQPFSTMQPTLGLNYCICLSGTYPTRAQ